VNWNCANDDIAAGGGGGDITDVIAGAGLTGGAASGAATLALDTGFTDARYLRLLGGTLTGALNLPVDGLVVGGVQLVAAGGLVGIGTSSPAASMHAFATGTHAVRGTTTGSGFFGVLGEYTLTSGPGIGVRGVTASAEIGTAGVVGEATDAGPGIGGNPTGVMGISRSTSGIGVLGYADNANGGVAGVFDNPVSGPLIIGRAGGGLAHVFEVQGTGAVRASSYLDFTTMKNVGLLLTCLTGQIMKWNGTDWVCDNDATGGGGPGAGDITDVIAGTGLTGGATSGAATLALDTAFTDARYLQLTGGTLTGNLTGATGVFTASTPSNGTTFLASQTGTGYGLTGNLTTDANGSAGVAGRATSAGVSTTYGVLGESASSTGRGGRFVGTSSTGLNAGVQGVTNSSQGVAGEFINAAGGNILQGRNNSVEQFRVDGAGSVFGGGFFDLTLGTRVSLRTDCANGQVMKWNSPTVNNTWQCDNDAGGGGGGSGDITGVFPGQGLTGGASTGDATLALDTSFTDARYAQTAIANFFGQPQTAPRFISNVATGTPPFAVSSTTTVSNLSADTIDGIDSTALARLNITNNFSAGQQIIGSASLGLDVSTNAASGTGVRAVVNGSNGVGLLGIANTATTIGVRSVATTNSIAAVFENVGGAGPWQILSARSTGSREVMSLDQNGLLRLPALGTATTSMGFTSGSTEYVASSFHSGLFQAQSHFMRWQAEPANNNTTSATGKMTFLGCSTTTTCTPTATGLEIGANGIITFAPGQTFPGGGGGSGDLTDVLAGTGISVTNGAGPQPSVAIDTAVVPRLNVANTFTFPQTVSSSTFPVIMGTTTGATCGGLCPAIEGITTGNTSINIGVRGVASAVSGSGFGLFGTSASTFGTGGYGEATAVSGSTIGVHGRVVSTAGTAVRAESTATTGSVLGVNSTVASSSGEAIRGESTATTGSPIAIRGRVASNTGTAAMFETTNPALTTLIDTRNHLGVSFFNVNSSGIVKAESYQNRFGVQISLRTDCNSGEGMQWNGTAWVCAAGSGTVTSISQGNGIIATPNPITGTGTIAANFTASGGDNGTSTTVARGNHTHNNLYAQLAASNSFAADQDIQGNLTTSGDVTSNRFVSTQPTGLSPFQVSSTTKVTSLNADLLDGFDSAAFARTTVANNFSVDQSFLTNVNVQGTLFGVLASLTSSDTQPALTVTHTNPSGGSAILATSDLSGNANPTIEADATGINAIAIRGDATASTGSGIGVNGTSSAASGIGVSGQATGSGASIAVRGIASGTSGAGVVGSATASAGGTVGIWGFTSSPSGAAGQFENISAGGGNIIVGRSSSATVFRVTTGGDVAANGTYFCGSGAPACLQTGSADFAEAIETEGDKADYAPGDVLVIDPTAMRRITHAAEPYSRRVAGIYSTRPAVLGGAADEEALKTRVPVAVVGIVPCKVSAENGAIEIGDLLVTSSTPAHAMKGTDFSRMLGAIVGKALQPFTPPLGPDGKPDRRATGAIEVLVTLQ